MKITVLGATGMVGTRVVDEALRRGHPVTAVARTLDPDRWPDHVTPVPVDAGDPAAVGRVVDGADAVVLTIRATPGDEQRFLDATTAVLAAGSAAGVRILVVGGAGPLRSPTTPDRLVVDDPGFVPVEWREIAAVSSTQLELCRAAGGAGWTYLSPPAELEPGDRTGRYRRGTDTLLLGTDGRSRVSAEDLAVAIVDELERPAGEQHFTVVH